MPPRYSTSTILDHTLEGNEPINRADKYIQAEKENVDLALRVNPAQIAQEKYQRLPNKYLPIEEKFYGQDIEIPIGHQFTPDVSDYFLGLHPDSLERDLYISIGNFIEITPEQNSVLKASEMVDVEKDYQREQLEILETIGEYFLTYANETHDKTNASLPEEIKALRRTAISIYKAARLNLLTVTSGSNKMVVKPPTKGNFPELEDLDIYDTLIERLIPPTYEWDGYIPHVSANQLFKLKERELLEKPVNVRLSGYENWDIDHKYGNRLRRFGNRLEDPPYNDIKTIERLMFELPNPSVLPEIRSRNVDSKRKAYYVEHIPKALFDEDQPEENALATLAVARILDDMANTGNMYMDIKPSNFRRRDDNGVVMVDLGEVGTGFNNEIVNIQELTNLSFNAAYAAPELFIVQELHRTKTIEDCPLTNLSKAQAYSLGAMLFKSQFGSKIIEDTDSPESIIAYSTQTEALGLFDSEETIASEDLDIQLLVDNISRIYVLEILAKNPKAEENPYIALILDALEPDPKARITRQEFITELQRLIN